MAGTVMKIYESITRKELEERFKPIKCTFSPWPFAVTSIKGITERQTTQTGQVNYIVEFKNGQTKQIPAKSLNETKKQLVEDFELQRFHQSQHFQRTTRKRVNTFKLKPEIRKKARFQAANNTNSDENESNNPNSDGLEDKEARPTSVTRSGRKSTQSKTYDIEFYAGKIGVKNRAANVFKVPLPEDPYFISQHSELCYRCNEAGTYKGPVDVPVGPEAKKIRLLFCKSCSYSIHNNCLPQVASYYIDHGQISCVKCQKKSGCAECYKDIPDRSDKELAFRCNLCFRGFHKKCIRKGVSSNLAEESKESDVTEIYESGLCFECLKYGQKSASIIAERTVGDKTEFLLKWKNISYRHCTWVVESWMQGAQAVSYRAYIKKRSEQVFVPRNSIPIEWKTVDRILNVEWLDKSKTMAKKILAVFKDTSYEDAVWDEPPTEDETEFYPDYQIALKRYILASRVKPPIGVKQLISDVRKSAKTESYEKHELKSQPGFMNGGTLMKHQLEALNWLLYQWENKQSCILADDMGLGKTIQIIGYLYTLYKKFNIYPFVIVVPNSTATNWIREFKKWAPEMVVAPFFGGQLGRKLALENEIFDDRMNLKCHVVVTTYESSMETSKLQHLFWAVMVVDESQRLKNDESLLFKTLKKYNVDQITLLTGTPLQNNLRELFNIMNFIQPKQFHGNEASGYDDMTKLKVDELHNRLRPHFLRRTKEEVLKTLPPKYELIVPISMTPLQKEVYKQCLSREIYETLNLATGSKIQKGLSSIFMNLRKVLNHPYLLDGVETTHPTPEETQSAMINACGKLMLFHQVFPKLKVAGHRILIFSTMTRVLDILEDYMNYENINYVRLDGSCNERSRVRSIDAFNAPNSKIDVFLLSTRAGGVGINLTTADTVIIWDSDFNPYADLQAISRAHRIGQNNMVLILRLMTRLTVEEKVLQIGKKKMALEHVVVERMKENEEDKVEDIEDILKFGAEALFADDDSKDISYDSVALDNLLDREKYREAAIENQKEEIRASEEGKAKAAEQGLNFSFAKVWKADGSVEELASDGENQKEDTSSDFWQKFLKEKEVEAERIKEKKRLAAENLGRGARKRAVVTYRESNKSKKADPTDTEFVFEENALSDPEEFEENALSDLEEFEADETTTNEPKQQVSPKLNVAKPVIMHAEQNSFQSVFPTQPLYLNQLYQENLYTEVFKESIPYIIKLKSISSKAFQDNFHTTHVYKNMMDAVYQELSKAIDHRFIENGFMLQLKDGLSKNIEHSILDNIYKAQLALLHNLKQRVMMFVQGDMDLHFKNLEALQKRTVPERNANLSMEHENSSHLLESKKATPKFQQKASIQTPIQPYPQKQAQVYEQAHTQQHFASPQQQDYLSRQHVQQLAYAKQQALKEQLGQRAAAEQQAREIYENRVFAREQHERNLAATKLALEKQQAFEKQQALERQQAFEKQQALERQQALEKQQAPSQNVTQLTPDMALQLQNYLMQHQGQQVNLQDFFNDMSLKAAEEQKAKHAAKAAIEYQRQKDEEALKAKQASTYTKILPTQQSPYNNNPYQPNQSRPYVDPDSLQRKNAEYFQNISPELRRSLFNAPPPLPDKCAIDSFEKTTSISPSPALPSTLDVTSQVEKSYQDALRILSVSNANPNATNQ